MSPSLSLRVLRQGRTPVQIAFYAITITVWAVYLLFLLRNFVYHRSPYVYGDWLINYGAGFIRRGLGGETLISLGYVANLSMDYVAFVLVAVLATYFFWRVLSNLSETITPFEIVVLFSPAALLFSAIDVGNAGRKDILLLALFALFAHVIARSRYQCGLSALETWALFTSGAIACLIHETIAFYSPIFAMLIFLRFVSHGRLLMGSAIATGLIVMMGTILLIVSVTTPAPVESVRLICERIPNAVPQGCLSQDGAIGWLQQSAWYSIGTVIQELKNAKYLWLYGLPFAIAVTLLVLFVRRFEFAGDVVRSLPPVLNHPALPILLLGLGCLPLFVLAVDWGRWFSMWFTFSVLYLLFGTNLGFLTRKGGATDDWFNGLVIVFAPLTLLWSIPVCCQSVPPLGMQLLSITKLI